MLPASNTLSHQLGVDTKEIKGWMAEERKVKGQTVSSSAARTNSGQVTPRE
jgi:hypothetical protein